jgi:hypothetical protein
MQTSSVAMSDDKPDTEQPEVDSDDDFSDGLDA